LTNFFKFWGKSNQTEFADLRLFFEALQREEPAAIRHLGGRATKSILAIGKNHQLSFPETEELLGDAVAIFIQKTREGLYAFLGNDPTTYVIECAKKLAMTRARSHARKPEQALPEHFERADGDFFYATFENTQLVDSALTELGEPCSDIIRWYYLEEMADREIIEQGKSTFKNESSLRTRRSQCLKVLSKLFTEKFIR
jgi:hypothetical protein